MLFRRSSPMLLVTAIKVIKILFVLSFTVSTTFCGVVYTNIWESAIVDNGPDILPKLISVAVPLCYVVRLFVLYYYFAVRPAFTGLSLRPWTSKKDTDVCGTRIVCLIAFLSIYSHQSFCRHDVFRALIYSSASKAGWENYSNDLQLTI